MPLPTVPCKGKTVVEVITEHGKHDKDLIFECVKVKKVFDEFALRDCVECIKFELERCHDTEIHPVLVLRNCKVCDSEVKDISNGHEKKLKFSGKCCCDVYGKDRKGNLVRMRVIDMPCSDFLSIGPDGELCFCFNVKREYPHATKENFKNLLHFLDEKRFELQCFIEAVIDEDNNVSNGEYLTTNLGAFLAVKFDAEVQLCIPVLGYCEIEEVIPIEESFCEKFETEFDLPSFNPAQLDKPIHPYRCGCD